MYNSEYKVGDIVWFIASISSPFKLCREIPCAGGTIGRADLEITYKFSPIPICGEIKSIYVINRTYYTDNDKVVVCGGRRVSGAKGTHALHSSIDEIQYEIQICIPPSLFRAATNNFFSKFCTNSYLDRNIPFFVSGIVSVSEWFVANTPEKAELLYSEWKADDWDDSKRAVYYKKDKEECFKTGLLYSEVLKELHGIEDYTTYHSTIKNIGKSMYGKSVASYKYTTYKRIP